MLRQLAGHLLQLYFCAYHSWYFHTGSAVPYVFLDIPYVDPAGCHSPDGFTVEPEPNGTADVAIDAISHEEREAATDPEGSAWFDANGNEADDKCIDSYGSLIGQTGSMIGYNQAIGLGQYETQLEWSNALHGCYQTGRPEISSISPGSAPGGASVGITGANFFAPLGFVPTVLFNGHPSSSVTVDSPTHLTVTVPGGNATGHVTVQALGGGGTSTQVFGLKPTLTSFSVSSGFAGQTITVNGAGFFGVTAVKFNGVVGAFSSVALDGTSLHVVIPAAATTGTVSVTTAGGTGVSVGAFVVHPHVTSFTPLAAVGGANVTIAGTGFSGIPTVDFSGSPSATLVSHTATSLVVQVPVDATVGPLTVHTADGDSTSVASLKPVPKITGFDHASYQVGETVTVSGSSFTANGALTAKLGATAVAPGSLSATSFQFTIPDTSVTALVSATTGDGTATSPVSLKVRPTITGDPAPNDGVASQHIVLSGKTFAGTTSVKFGGNTEAAPFTIGIGGTTLNVTVPGKATSGTIGVTNAGGLTQTSNNFIVHPRIGSFAPGMGAVGTAITLNGSGFAGADAVNFGGGVSAGPTAVTATSLHVVAPPGATTGPLTVHTASGGTSAASATPFTVTFSVTSISPTFGNYNDDVVVNGVGLTGVTAVKFNGIAGAIQPGGTATLLHVHAPTSGPITGHVTVWKGTASAQAPQDFTLLGVDSFNLSQGTRGEPVTITGHGFTGATHVRFNGTDAATFTVDSDIQITAVVPRGATDGTISVTVPAGTATSSGSFTVEHVTINEFQTAGTTAQDEFVELVNTGPDAVDISGCTLVYRTAAGTSDTVLATVPASTSLTVGHYYVFGGNTYPGVPDQSFSTDLDSTGGGLALRCYAGNTIVDSVGYGTATNAYVGTAAAPVSPASESAGRKPDGADTGDNSADFQVLATPTPGATNGP